MTMLLRRRLMMEQVLKKDAPHSIDDTSAWFKRATANGHVFNHPNSYGNVGGIKGNTLVWNQLVPEISYDTWGSKTYISYNNSEAHIVYDFSGGDITQPSLTLKPEYRVIPITGHKYYMCYEFKTGADQSELQFNTRFGAGNIVIGTLSASLSWTRKTHYIVASNENYLMFWFYVPTTGDRNVKADAYVRNIQIYDLTLMFGAGNEPSTAAEFEALFPLDYYAYNSGRLLNFTGESIVSKDANNNILSTLNLDITSWTGKLNGEGNSVTIFPEGLKSAESVYDEIVKVDGVWKGIKRVECVDLGDLSWSYNDTNLWFLGWSPSTLTQQMVIKPNTNALLTYKYTTVSSNTANNLFPDKGVKSHTTSNKYIYIKDSSYSDASLFKAAMSGVMLNYELETPLEYVLDNAIQALLNETYKVETNGLESIEPVNDDEPTTSPAKLNITYKSKNKIVVSGVVTDGSNPISGVLVTLGTRTSLTNVNGEYKFYNIKKGTYTLSASKDGYTFPSTTLNVNGEIIKTIIGQ